MSFSATLTTEDGIATIKLSGELDASTASQFHDKLDEVARSTVQTLILQADELSYIASAGLRVLVFARQKLGEDVHIVITGAADAVARTIRMAGLDRGIEMTVA
jgi:anti-anti-sigma factor